MRFWCLILALASLFTFINGYDQKCSLPKKEGSGRYLLTRFYHNASIGCISFWYKGQGGNGNNFVDLRTCQKTCTCASPLNNGTGSSNLPMWYYDGNNCSRMWYKGNGGNSNKFATLEQCQKTCVDDICQLTPVAGTAPTWACLYRPCIFRYSYHRNRGICDSVYSFASQKQVWNGNSFKTKAECRAKCSCHYQKNAKQVPSANDSTSYFLDRSSQKCQVRIMNDDSDNNFNTIEECNDKCVCSQPPVSGPGNSYFDKYFFNPITKMCEKFTYGGQGGNANRFNTKTSCIFRCGCLQEKDPGKSFHSISGKETRFYYNRYEQKCEAFTYEGEGGNSNNFRTYQACTRSCGVCKADVNPYQKDPIGERFYFDKNNKACKKYNDGEYGSTANNFKTEYQCVKGCICDLPADYGSGRSGFAKYYFNKTSLICKKFNYSGKGGNMNRFETLNDCKKNCACGLPKHDGYNGKSQTRYYFDVISGTCKSFRYKGQGGNDNNFNSMWDCNKYCRCDLPKDSGTYGPIAHKLYYFDRVRKDCFELEDGYEGGNGNAFKTVASCKQACIRTT